MPDFNVNAAVFQSSRTKISAPALSKQMFDYALLNKLLGKEFHGHSLIEGRRGGVVEDWSTLQVWGWSLVGGNVD